MMDSDAAWAAGRDVRKFLAGCVQSGQVQTYREERRIGLWPAVLVTAAVGTLAGWLASVIPW